jgi:UDPglucose 6-dehydrogenase
LHKNFGQQIIQIDPTEAELVKYFSNVLNSTRIVFANVFFEVCSKIGADYQNVLKAAVNLPNIQHTAYLQCSPDQRGYAGKCLPKDIAAFDAFVASLGVSTSLLSAVIKDNEHYVR